MNGRGLGSKASPHHRAVIRGWHVGQSIHKTSAGTARRREFDSSTRGGLNDQAALNYRVWRSISSKIGKRRSTIFTLGEATMWELTGDVRRHGGIKVRRRISKGRCKVSTAAPCAIQVQCRRGCIWIRRHWGLLSFLVARTWSTIERTKSHPLLRHVWFRVKAHSKWIHLV